MKLNNIHMKTAVKTLVLIILCLVLLIRCNKGLLPDVPVEKSFSIVASAGAHGKISPSGILSVKANDRPLYTITPDDGYVVDKLKVDNTEIAASNTYQFSNILSNGTIEVSFVSKYFLSLTKGSGSGILPIPWHLTNLSQYDDNNNYLDSLLLIQTPTRLTDNYYYYTNGKCEVYTKDNSKLLANGTWTIDGDKLIWSDGSKDQIIELTDKKFVLDTKSFVDSDGVSKHLRQTFERK